MRKMQEYNLSNEKYPKEIRPMPFASCAPSFLSGFAGMDFLFLPPLRVIPNKNASARRGITGYRVEAVVGVTKGSLNKIQAINCFLGLRLT
jgi:hypothetical protein